MTELEIFSGEDFSLVLDVENQGEELTPDLADYDVTIELSTKPLATVLKASTKDDAPLTIERISSSSLIIQIPHSQTALLADGYVTLTISLEHKQTLEISIVELKTIKIVKPKTNLK